MVIAITDHGRWREPRFQPDYRGHGLRMMHGCMDALHIEHSPRGTTVIMTNRTVPAKSSADTKTAAHLDNS